MNFKCANVSSVARCVYTLASSAVYTVTWHIQSLVPHRMTQQLRIKYRKFVWIELDSCITFLLLQLSACSLANFSLNKVSVE